jgi:hypothetical protein
MRGYILGSKSAVFLILIGGRADPPVGFWGNGFFFLPRVADAGMK